MMVVVRMVVMVMRTVMGRRRWRRRVPSMRDHLGDPLGRELHDEVDDPALLATERAARSAPFVRRSALAGERVDPPLEGLEAAHDLVHTVVHRYDSTLRAEADHSACSGGCIVTPAPASTRYTR